MAEQPIDMWDGAERRKGLCYGHCYEHSGNTAKIEALMSRMDVVQRVPDTVASLSSRVNLVLYIFSAIALLTVSGTLYAFTAVNSFSKTYTEDREKDRIERQIDRKETRERIQELTDSNNEMRLEVQEQINDLGDNIDGRLDDITERMIKLESK